MCGITGIIRWGEKKVSEEEISRMNACIKHRGPDGDGIFVRDGVAFGHQRLSIIDLALGKQPMHDASRQYTITFNGEIYNFKELKEELQGIGHQFQTTSDTEVVLHSYIQWGMNCVNKLRGMFAFGIADFNKKKIFLARDHFGIKPLLYRQGEGFLAFASEFEPFKKVDAEPLRGSLTALESFLCFQYIPAPASIYVQVKKLLPGHCMEINLDGTVADPTPFFKFKFTEPVSKSSTQWVEEADQVLTESVQAHLVSDVPFGVYLSGGIDSTLVAWKMKEILKGSVKAFTIGFDDPKYSEVPFAKKAAEKIGVELITETVTDESLYKLPEILRNYGEPFGDSSAIPTWYVSKLARSHVPMVLSGDGGDELFGGYGSYLAYYGANPIKFSTRFNDGNKIKQVRRKFRAMIKRALGLSLNEVDRWMGIIQYVQPEHRLNLWRKELAHEIMMPDPTFRQTAAEADLLDPLSFAQFMDVNTYLPYDILPKVDIASMYHGLEVRPPMIDTKVAEFAAGLPFKMKINLIDGKPTGKYLLKKVMEKGFSKDFIYRKKQGFAIPRDKWLEKGNIGYNYFSELVFSQPKLKELFNMDVLETYFKSHSRANDLSNMLWLFLVLAIWLEENKDITFE